MGTSITPFQRDFTAWSAAQKASININDAMRAVDRRDHTSIKELQTNREHPQL